MNGSCESPQPTLCGCCQGITAETPELITNRPGLSAISYRVGTHTTFFASLLAALSGSAQPALASLRTRDPSDFSIALLDAWATCLDILTFYQERIANESYLRTAVDSASVFALAQLVGYRPSPGVAASTFLAFTLTSAPGSPDNVLIPAGTRVQSVPKPGQKPQVFETSAAITALIEENAIPAQTTTPWALNPQDTSMWLQGTSNNLNVGDGILFISQALYSAAAVPGSNTATGAADFHFVTSVTLDADSGNTRVAWDKPLNWPVSNDHTVHVYAFRKKASLFGVQAPDPRTLFSSSSNNNLSNLTGWPPGGNGDWIFQDGYTNGSYQINLDASYPGTAPPQSGALGWTVLVCPNFTALYQVTAAVDTGPVLYTLTTKTTQLTLANGQVLVNNLGSAANLTQLEAAVDLAAVAVAQAVSTGGNVAQAEQDLQQAVANLTLALGSASSDLVLEDIVGQTRSATAYIQSAPLTPADPPITHWVSPKTPTYPLAPGMIVPVQGSSISLVGGLGIAAGQPIGISGLRVRLQVLPSAGATFMPDGASAALPVADNQVFLINAYPPATDPKSGNPLWTVLTTGNVSGSLLVESKYVQFLPANSSDPPAGEAAVVSTVQVSASVPNVVTLSLESPLAGIYDATTLAVNANTVAATNGETQNEIMGSGDATNPALEFTLKQSPLTYVSSTLNHGAVSTLQVWVNNLQWHEVDNFLASLPTDRVFITQTDSKQNVTVQFGDGIEGERTPTGQMNIRAVYRKGIGSGGNLQSGQLSQALDRPQGLSSVTNPGPATGGADPATAADARASAPLQVLTLGRVVSLEDYQNYALAFGGIAQALATWTWSGRTRGVFLTVAGANGDVFQPDDLTLTNLRKALWSVGNPHVPIQVMSYNPVPFEVGANVRIDLTDYDPTQVLAQVWQTLSTSFSFAERQLGQGVAQSEVIEFIQQTPGVVAVQLTAFNRQGQAPTVNGALRTVLLAASPAAGQTGAPQGAEMLMIDPASQGNFVQW
jgi:hypothetical protein